MTPTDDVLRVLERHIEAHLRLCEEEAKKGFCIGSRALDSATEIRALVVDVLINWPMDPKPRKFLEGKE